MYARPSLYGVSDHPLVSIILPVFNSAPYLSECISSISQQTYVNWEVIAVDDGSTDGSSSILASWESSDERVHVTTFESNKGIVDALNTAIGLCRGSLICRMDADDIMVSTRLSSQVRYMNAHPDIHVLGTGAELFREGSTETRTVIHACDVGSVHLDMFFNCCLIHPSVMLRTCVCREDDETVMNKLQYSNQFPHVEDLDLWLNIIVHTQFKMTNIQDSLLRLRKHASNISTMQRQKQSDAARATAQHHICQLTGSSPAPEVLDCLMHPDKVAPYLVMEAGVALVEQLATALCLHSTHLTVTERDSIQDAASKRIGQLAAMAMSLYPMQAPTMWARWLRRNPRAQLTQLLNSSVGSIPALIGTKEPCLKDTLHVIVFSKDRAFQLKEYLRTLHELVIQPSSVQVQVAVLYYASPPFQRSYRQLQKDYPKVRFVSESSLGHQLVELVRANQTEFTMFGVDDVIFFREFNVSSAMEVLRTREDIAAYHIKLHPGVTYSHPADAHMTVPTLAPVVLPDPCEPCMSWTREGATHDWAYPWELCASVYRTQDVALMLDAIVTQHGIAEGLGHPNRLEASGHQLHSRIFQDRPMCACPRDPVACAITVNRVQSVISNRIYLECAVDIDQMDAMLWEGARIDTGFYKDKGFNSVHVGDFVLEQTSKSPP
eukprot:TRINITY_DN12853_c0_g1_i1.p1 TRINITY_DN12853_c0_g1~~TRINITY_DN12853_c0_g1_i1.p1  ORF type:complete len:663 (-),score=90.88 TRINITY_DN12853_c0_g1_i1:379-2367(-)